MQSRFIIDYLHLQAHLSCTINRSNTIRRPASSLPCNSHGKSQFRTIRQSEITGARCLHYRTTAMQPPSSKRPGTHSPLHTHTQTTCTQAISQQHAESDTPSLHQFQSTPSSTTTIGTTEPSTSRSNLPSSHRPAFEQHNRPRHKTQPSIPFPLTINTSLPIMSS